MDKRYEYFKEQYYHELNRKEHITSSVSVTVGFISAIYTVYAYFGLNITELEVTCPFFLFVGFWAISLFFGIKATIFIFLSIMGKDFRYTPEPMKVYDFEQKYLDYNKEMNIADENELNAEFFDKVKLSYVNSAEINRSNNNYRAKKISKANNSIIFAITFLIISSIPFFICKYQSKDKNSNKNPVNVYFYDRRP